MSNSRSPRAVLSITIGIRGMPHTLRHGAVRDYDRGPLKPTSPEIGERVFGVVEVVDGDARLDWHLAGEGEELFAVLAGEVGHAANAPLLPQVVVGKAGDIRHVNAGTDDGPTRGQ